MDPITLLVGGVLVVGGWLAGHVSGRAAARRTASRPPALVCSCSHGPGYHDDTAGPCHGEISRSRYSKQGSHIGYEHVPCTCRAYDGPEPLPRAWTPPAIP